MKLRLFPIVLSIAMVFGAWVLGYLRFPYVSYDQSFWLGLVTGILLLGALLLAVVYWKWHHWVKSWIGSDQITNPSKRMIVIWRWLLLLMVVMLLVGSRAILSVIRQYQGMNIELRDKVVELKKSISQMGKEQQGAMISGLLYAIENELGAHQPDRALSDATIQRIGALSHALTPYFVVEADSLSEVKRSPERAQLLLALLHMDLDTSTLNQIKMVSTFALAELKNSNLKNVDLSGADLREANLEGADLSNANLRGCQLTRVSLRRANLDRADLSNAVMKYSDLSWAQLTRAQLTRADLSGSTIENVQMRYADLEGAIIRGSKFNGSMLKNTNFTHCDLYLNEMKRVDLTDAILSHANIGLVDLDEAVLHGVVMDSTEIQDKWFDLLKQYRVQDAEHLMKKYTVGIDSTVGRPRLYYLIVR